MNRITTTGEIILAGPDRKSDMNFVASIQLDLNAAFLGDLLGKGVSRSVYVMEQDSTKVVKVETQKSFQNVMEWETWQHVKGTEYAKWFAPCHFISEGGSVLIMERTEEVSKIPKRVPAFLSDLKRTNFGTLNKRFVCRDYGTNLLMHNGLTARMKPAKFWG